MPNKHRACTKPRIFFPHLSESEDGEVRFSFKVRVESINTNFFQFSLTFVTNVDRAGNTDSVLVKRGLDGKDGVRSAECGVRSVGCGKCGVWKMRSIACGNALTFLFNIKNALKWFTLDNWKTKTFLVYDENGEENVHYFTTRHKHLSEEKKKTLPVLTI